MPNKTPTEFDSMDALIKAFNASRAHSVKLIEPLSPEDCQAQSMEDASPAKWHLAHVTWFYEVMVLKPFEDNFQYWNPAFAILFNSYYNGIGDKHPRHQRGLLTRPSLGEVLVWRNNINERVNLLLKKNHSQELQKLVEIGISHEQQHQELLLTDIQHLFFQNALLPIYSESQHVSAAPEYEFKWLEGASGLVNIGYSGEEFHFDNESPSHTAFNQTHSISNILVSNAEWDAFIEDGGYQDARWWLDAGWAWVKSESISAPLYWNLNSETQKYCQFSLKGNLPLNPQAPVCNVSYFEADAFARWASQRISHYAGARLPTEFEWEALSQVKPKLALNLFGEVWQWTSSSYSAYPGYQPWSGIAGEYNGKFMVNQMVLRGSSAYTTPGHSRNTYRNFFPAPTRWQMTGLRLAKDGI